MVPTVVESPRHGSITLSTSQAVYTPVAGYMGRDSFLLSWPAPVGTQQVRFEIRVLPRHIPLFGAFTAHPAAPALYDSWSRSFILCDPADPTGVAPTLNCWRQPTKYLPPANYFPMVWPGDQGSDQLALYNSETGVLHFLEFFNGYFEPRDSINLAPMTGGWPVLGDWDGTGEVELAMVFDDGRVYVLGPSSWELWPQTLTVPTEDDTLWPVVRNHPGLPSWLVYASPSHGGLDWLSCERSHGCTSGYIKSLTRYDFRRALGGYGVRFLVLLDDSLQLIVGKYSFEDPAPNTIPVKFPDDPIGGSGGG